VDRLHWQLSTINTRGPACIKNLGHQTTAFIYPTLTSRSSWTAAAVPQTTRLEAKGAGVHSQWSSESAAACRLPQQLSAMPSAVNASRPAKERARAWDAWESPAHAQWWWGGWVVALFGGGGGDGAACLIVHTTVQGKATVQLFTGQVDDGHACMARRCATCLSSPTTPQALHDIQSHTHSPPHPTPPHMHTPYRQQACLD
jgi:hypothetical protein